MPIKTIVLEVDGVLFNGSEMFSGRLRSRLDRNLTGAEQYGLNSVDAIYRGKMTEAERWKWIISVFGWKIAPRDLENLMRDCLVPIRDTMDLVFRLHKNGYRLAILSDHAREWIEYIQASHGFHRYFHSRSYSFETSFLKPQEEAYLDILSKLGKPDPEECLLVDTRYPNVAAARYLGFKTHLFINAGLLEEELRQHEALV